MDSGELFSRFFEGAKWPCSAAPYGNGDFGEWAADPAGNPCYHYGRPDTGEDHWHMLGNDRIVATAHNGGYVELWDWSRVLKAVNRFDPAHLNFAGGFKVVTVNGRTTATLRNALPDPASMKLVFGLGYCRKETHLEGLALRESYAAPQGDIPAVLSETEIRNDSQTPAEIRVVEYWGCNVFQIAPAVIMTGRGGRLFTRWRERFNKKQAMVSHWDPEASTLWIEHVWNGWRPQWPKDWRSPWDDHYPAVFLTALDTLPAAFTGYATEAAALWTPQGEPRPDARLTGELASRRSAFRGGNMLAIERAAQLEPGECATFRYAFGLADAACPRETVRETRKARHTPEYPAVSISTPEAPWLGRELTWHSYYLQGHAYRSDYFKTHFVDQGSAYSYLHGAISVPRDMSIYILALSWFRPDLAKECLRFQMQMQRFRSGKLPYCSCGYGLTTGFVLHSFSSDLDLFFLWGLSEYIGATGDYAFLDEVLPFYPPRAGKSGTVLEHARAAFRHLTRRVGVGRHGLLRSMSGDWNDVLLAFAPNPILSLLRGESTLNAGLATAALPAFAAIIEARDPALAAAARAFAETQAEALRKCFTGKWVHRGYLGKGDLKLGEDRLFLDTQGFGVLGGVWTQEKQAAIFAHVRERCVDPEPAGARCMFPPMEGKLLEPGMDTNGGTWAAVDAWTAIAWARHDPKAAWDFFLRATMAARAEAYPGIWYGIWSGPDSYNSAYHKDAGRTFNINLTPMTDFPIMNMNRHAGTLLAGLRLGGVSVESGVITLRPAGAPDDFAIRTPLVGGAWCGAKHKGYYAPVCTGTFRFAVAAPESASRLRLNGATIPFVRAEDGLVHFSAEGAPASRIAWEID